MSGLCPQARGLVGEDADHSEVDRTIPWAPDQIGRSAMRLD